MKNLLLLIILFLISAGGYLQAQEDCFITSARVSQDSNCLFLTWIPNLPQPLIVQVDGVRYFQNDTIAGTTRYSLLVNDSIASCDTTGWVGFEGEIDFELFGIPQSCEIKGGTDLPPCPDDVLISQSQNCLVFEFQNDFDGTLPDSVKLIDTTYYSQGFHPEKDPNSVVYLKDTNMVCDSSSMNSLLNDTLFIGQKVCTYDGGLLPITILAFNSQNEDHGVMLSWKVNSEEPTRQLYLQKSYNGVDWTNVYEQSMANATQGQTMDGHYKDVSVDQPKLYYRLFIAGYSGEEKYSNILPVTMKDQVINNLFYQPQSRSIMIKAGQNYTGQMYLINTQGQNVMTQKIQVLKNTYKEINVKSQLTPGIYFVKFDNGLIPPAKILIN